MTQFCFAPCEGIKGSLGFWTPRHGFRTPGTGFQIFFSGTWIPVVSGIPDSKAQDSGFNRQTFPRFWIPHAKMSKIPDSTCKNISRFRIPKAKISKIPGFHMQKFSRFRTPHAKISKIPDSASKNFQDSGIRTPLHGAIGFY